MKTEIKALISDINGLVAQKKSAETEAKVKEVSALDSKIEEMKSTLEAVEKQAYRVSNGSAAGRSEEMKTFSELLSLPVGQPLEGKYLRTDRDPDGGYLVPREMYGEIVGKIVEISDFRRLARVTQISGKALDTNRRDSDISVNWYGEGQTVSASDPQYNRQLIPAHKMMAENRITHELMADSAFDMVSELNQRVAIKFAQTEGAAFVNGTGINQPEGFLNAAGILNVNSGDANLLTADAFFDMMALMKYRNPVFLMNRKTFVAARKLKNAVGDYLLQQGFDGNLDMRLGGSSGSIAGIPIILMQDMPDVAAGNKPVVLIDPQEAYLIVDRIGMSVRRDDITLMSEDKVKFVINRRVGGAVIAPEAVISMTVSV